MKFTKKLATLAVTALAVVSLTACSNKSSNSSAKIPTKISKKTTVVFWHGMVGGQEKALKNMAKEFEAKNPKIHIKLENQGKYSDLQAKINSTLQSPKNLPTISQAYPGWLLVAAQAKKLVDMKPYITNSKIGWGSVTKSDIRTDLLKGAQIKGVQYGIPFNKSIEVLLYNKDLLKKYGVKVPKNMAELKKAAKVIYKKSDHKVVGAGFDSLSNYYALGMKEKGHDFNNKIDFTSSDSKSIIDFYANGIKDGYFQTAGSAGYLSGDFSNQKLAMYVGSSAGECFVKMGVGKKFEYGVAPRPSEYNIAQGTDIYMFDSASADQKAAAFMFIKFLLTKENQLAWADKTGYIPVTNTVISSEAYKESKKTKMPPILTKAMANLYSVPVVKNSNAAYASVNTELQAVFAQAKKHKDWSENIKKGQHKIDSAWKQ